MKENVIEWIANSDTATVTFSQQKYINAVMKLAENDPDAVKIIEQPDNNNGYLVAYIRLNRVRINTKPPLSDEVRNRLAEQAKRNFGR